MSIKRKKSVWAPLHTKCTSKENISERTKQQIIVTMHMKHTSLSQLPSQFIIPLTHWCRGIKKLKKRTNIFHLPLNKGTFMSYISLSQSYVLPYAVYCIPSCLFQVTLLNVLFCYHSPWSCKFCGRQICKYWYQSSSLKFSCFNF